LNGDGFLWKGAKDERGEKTKIEEKKADAVHGYPDYAIVCYHDM
jgi:hypothetical protein